MFRGLYIATTNMQVNSARIDAVSNNIANFNTYGFKKDDAYGESFNDVLIAKYNGSSMPAEGANTGVSSVDNGDGTYNVAASTGYFRVSTANGVSYNKEAKFYVDPQGFLSTVYYNSDRTVDSNLGDRLVGQNGTPIQVGVGAKVTVGKNGEITVGGAKVDSLLNNPMPNIIGTINAGVRTKRIVTDFAQGSIIPTENATDFALTAPGFFVVDTPYGKSYTRNGTFKLDANMEMVTNEGYHVQGINGNIKLASNHFTTNEFGEIMIDGTTVDKIKTVDFKLKGNLDKVGGTMFMLRQGSNDKEEPYTGSVVQGSLEQSNADNVSEMVKLMDLYRNYESGQKLVKAYDDSIGRAVNEVGKV